ncbi:MAG: hypothetical protein WDO13_12485 [Verrucomicrobiota bacterium]
MQQGQAEVEPVAAESWVLQLIAISLKVSELEHILPFYGEKEREFLA